MPQTESIPTRQALRDEIERELLWTRAELRDELLKLRSALKPFAELAQELRTNRQRLGVLTDDDFVTAAAAYFSIQRDR